MATFGGYETARELSRSGLATVWSALPVGAAPDTPPEHTVKVFRPLVAPVAGEESAAEVELFLESVGVQRKVADAGADHWAPIYESGPTEGGAFYVSKYYERSLQQVIRGRVRLSGQALGSIVDSVVQGLLELREACDRPHGDLKPSNVLVEGTGDLAHLRGVLIDPLPTSQLDPAAGPTADVRAVGQLVYQLVLHKPFQEMTGWPIADSDDWRRLGSVGGLWRELCNRLLDPGALPDELALEHLAEEVARIRKGKLSLLKLGIAAVVVAALAVCGPLGYRRAREWLEPPPTEFKPEPWARLCHEYYYWFGAVRGKLTPQRRERWRADPALAKAVQAIARAEQKQTPLDPRKLAGAAGGDYLQMAGAPPEGARTPEGVNRTKAALAIIDDVKAAFTRGGWPKLKLTCELADQWDQRQWRRPAYYLRSAAAAVEPSKRIPNIAAAMPSAELPRLVEDILQLHDTRLKAVKQLWGRIQTAQTTLNASGDDILKALDAYWPAEAASEPGQGSDQDLQKLETGLGELAATAAALAAFVEGDWADDKKFDRKLFLRESEVHRNWDRTVSKHTIRLWQEEVKLYYRLREDPRGAKAEWDKRLAHVRRQIATLAESGGKAKTLADGYQQRLTGGVERSIAQMWQVPGVRKYSENRDLETKTEAASDLLDALQEEITRALIVYMGKPRDWLAGVLKFEFASSKVVNAEWKRRRGQLLVNITPGELEKKQEKYEAIRSNVDKLQDALAKLEGDQALPRGLPERARQSGSRAWHPAFTDTTAEQREHTLETALSVLPWHGAVPNIDDPQFASRWQELCADYRRWRDEAADVAAAVGAIEQGLDACHLLDEPLREGGKPLGSLWDEWARKPILRDPELTRALRPISERVARLRKIEGLTQRQALVEAALGSSRREAALAAWRRLGKVDNPPWPSTEGELKQDGEIRTRLASELQVIRDEARRKALQSALAGESQARRNRWLAAESQRLQKQIDKARDAIQASGDKILAQFGAFVQAEMAAVGEADHQARLDKLTKIHELATRLATFARTDWVTLVDRNTFTAKSRIHRDFKPPPTAQTFEQWLVEVPKYYFETPEEFAERIRSKSSISRSPELNRVWTERSDLLLRVYPVVLLQANKELYSSVRRRFGDLEALLAGLDDDKDLPRGLTPEAKRFFAPRLQAALVVLVDKKREQTLAAAAKKIPPGEDGFPAVTLAELKKGAQWQALVKAYVGYRDNMTSIGQRPQMVANLLDAGYLPDDKPDKAPETVRKLHDEWKEFRDAVPELRDQFKAVDQRMQAIEALEAIGDRQGLVAKARALVGEGAPPQHAMIIWRRLGTLADWPEDIAELALERSLRLALLDAAAKIRAENPHPVRWVAAEAAEQGRARWQKCFAQLVPRQAPTEQDEERLAAAIGMADDFGLTVAQLAPLHQFWRHLHAFRGKLRDLPEAAKKPEVAELVHEFRKTVESIPKQVARRPAVAQFLAKLDELLRQKDSDDPGAGLAKAGPASAPGGVWKATPAADGKSVEYTWAGRRSLRFARVEAPGGKGKPVFLCTTEASLGLFADVVASVGKWREVLGILFQYDPMMADPRKGPRVWELTRDRGSIEPSVKWLVILPGVRAPYFAGYAPGSPTKAHPMQYVSPEAALYVARLLGCRLPTSGEWQAAAATHAQGRARNLRDATWTRQQEHIAGLWRKGVRADWPDAGMFLPADADPKVEGQAQAATDADDGVLWFAPVGEGSGFHHLIGNVAEVVCEAAAPFEQAFRDIGGLSPDSLRSFVTRHGAQFRVVGGSALSPPELWNGKGKPFARGYPVVLDEARAGLSDVGFRLAFTAPQESVAARIRRFVRRQGYLAQQLQQGRP